MHTYFLSTALVGRHEVPTGLLLQYCLDQCSLRVLLVTSPYHVAVQYLEKFQGIKFQEPVWFKAGAVILNEPLNYLGQDNLVGARSIIATLAVQVRP